MLNKTQMKDEPFFNNKELEDVVRNSKFGEWIIDVVNYCNAKIERALGPIIYGHKNAGHDSHNYTPKQDTGACVICGKPETECTQRKVGLVK